MQIKPLRCVEPQALESSLNSDNRTKSKRIGPQLASFPPLRPPSPVMAPTSSQSQGESSFVVLPDTLNIGGGPSPYSDLDTEEACRVERCQANRELGAGA